MPIFHLLNCWKKDEKKGEKTIFLNVYKKRCNYDITYANWRLRDKLTLSDDMTLRLVIYFFCNLMTIYNLKG